RGQHVPCRHGNRERARNQFGIEHESAQQLPDCERQCYRSSIRKKPLELDVHRSPFFRVRTSFSMICSTCCCRSRNRRSEDALGGGISTANSFNMTAPGPRLITAS